MGRGSFDCDESLLTNVEGAGWWRVYAPESTYGNGGESGLLRLTAGKYHKGAYGDGCCARS